MRMEPLWMELKALRKEPQSFLDFFHYVKTQCKSGNRHQILLLPLYNTCLLFLCILLWHSEWNETLDDDQREHDSSNWGLRCRKDSEILYIVWDRWLRWDRLNNQLRSERFISTDLRSATFKSPKMMKMASQEELSKFLRMWMNNRRPKQLAGKKGAA